MTSTITQSRPTMVEEKSMLTSLPPTSTSLLLRAPPPTKNDTWVSRLPPSLIPYAELSRIHQPAGIYASLVPTLIGLSLAAASPTLTPAHVSLPTMLYLVLNHAVGNALLRGSACAYNDALDAPYDRLVARCKSRPVARGAVTPLQAYGFALFLFTLWIITLCFLPSPTTVVAPAALLVATMAIYPLCKRITHFPQLVLGISLAMALGIGYGSIGVGFLAVDSATQVALACLYVSYVVHTMIYDTVYAHQDLEDDLKAGVLSMAVLCQGNTKPVLCGLAVAEVGLLAATGWMMGCLGFWFWVGAIGGTTAVLGGMIKSVRLDEPKNCRLWFARLLWWTGACVIGGLGVEYLIRIWG